MMRAVDASPSIGITGQLAISAPSVPIGIEIKTFGQALRRERLAQNLSVHQVADRAGVAREIVTAWEQDECAPSRAEFKRLYKVAFSRLRWFAHLLPPATAAQARTEAKNEKAPLPTAATPPPHSAAVAEVGAALASAPASFGAALRAERLRAGLAQVELGQLLDVEQGAVSSWELETSIPIVLHLKRLDELFPALQDSPRPRSRPIGKPTGNEGNTAPEKLGTRRIQELAAELAEARERLAEQGRMNEALHRQIEALRSELAAAVRDRDAAQSNHDAVYSNYQRLSDEYAAARKNIPDGFGWVEGHLRALPKAKEEPVVDRALAGKFTRMALRVAGSADRKLFAALLHVALRAGFPIEDVHAAVAGSEDGDGDE